MRSTAYAPSTSTPVPDRRSERIAELEAELVAARVEVEVARGEALREARAEIANLQGKLAASEAAERERDEARAVLRAVEWAAPGIHGLRCPVCQRWKHSYLGALTHCVDHAPDCSLAAALVPPPRGATGPSGTRDGRSVRVEPASSP